MKTTITTHLSKEDAEKFEMIFNHYFDPDLKPTKSALVRFLIRKEYNRIIHSDTK